MTTLDFSWLDRNHRKRLLFLVAAIGLVIALTWSDPFHDFIDRIIAYLQVVVHRHPVWGVLLFVVFSAMSAMLAFFSSAVLVPVAVVAWGDLTTMALLWVGWLFGGVASYAVGRFLGRAVVGWVVPEEQLEHYEARVRRRISFPVVLLFQTAFPSEIPGYVLGIVRCRFRIYLAALAVAELPFAVGAVYLGRGFVERDYPMLIAFGFGGIVLIVTAIEAWHRRVSEP